MIVRIQKATDFGRIPQLMSLHDQGVALLAEPQTVLMEQSEQFPQSPILVLQAL